MNFLEAHRIVTAFAGGEPLPFVFALSGTPDPFSLYLRAAAAQRGRQAMPQTLPFNTLGQHVLRDPGPDAELLLILPWDLVPEADWRSGVPKATPDELELRDRAERFAQRIARRRAKVLYLPAPLPTLWADPPRVAALDCWLESLMRGTGARVLPASAFSLATYLSSGCPVGGSALGDVAEAAVESLLTPSREPAKVLVTDLDNTVWSGIVGDDGPDGIHHQPEGKGFPHFLYQTLLVRLRAEGVLLAAVSKNQPDAAMAPFRAGKMVLGEDDFVAIVASWNAKSAQIRDLAERLNLGLDAFVFVDDNPVELAEVELAVPAVERVLFPSNIAELPALFARLSTLFVRRDISEEDRQRTELYRRRLAGIAPSTVGGADLSEFLRDLGMTLTLREHSSGDRKRAVQLINKTNQFNLNGRRVTDEEIEALLADGGRLFGATLTDRTGSHGEILACVVDSDGVISSLVMSCRVFQRRVEYAFLAWLATQVPAPRAFAFASTERNEPIRQFLATAVGEMPESGHLRFAAEEFATRFSADRALFRFGDEASP